MLDSAVSVARTTAFWSALGRRDIDACIATLAPDVVRIGPRDSGEKDMVRGKDAYTSFLKRILATMPDYGNLTHEAVASDDGRHVYLHYSEFVAAEAGSRERIEVRGVLIFHLNDAQLINRIDCYWKQPREQVEWSRARNLIES